MKLIFGALGVVAVAAVVVFAVFAVTLSQRKAESLPNWSNQKLQDQLGKPDNTVNCAALGLDKTYEGSVYLDVKNNRLIILCAAP